MSNLYNEMVLIIMLFFLFITLMVSSSKIHLVLASVTGLYLVDIVISEKQHISSYVSSVKYFAHYYLFTKMIIDSAVITENLYSVIISSILTFIFTAWFMFLNSYGLFVPNANTKFRGYSAPMLILVLSMISWMVYDAI